MKINTEVVPITENDFDDRDDGHGNDYGDATLIATFVVIITTIAIIKVIATLIAIIKVIVTNDAISKIIATLIAIIKIIVTTNTIIKVIATSIIKVIVTNATSKSSSRY